MRMRSELAALAVWILGASAPFTVQPACAQAASSAAPAAVEAEVRGDLSPLAQRVLETFEPLPLEGGIALVPRSGLNGVRTLEIRGQQVRINGAPVSRPVLESWLQEAAPPVLELLDLSPSQRRRELGLRPEVEAEPPATTPGPVPAPPPASIATAGPEPPPAEAMEPPPEPESPPETVEELPERSAPPAARQRPRRPAVHSDAKVSFGDSVVVEENEIAEDLVVIGGSLRIDGEVLGDALAIGGPVRVDGRVSGDVAAIGGTVFLEDDAQVHGNVVSVGGGIERDPEATVFGELTEVAVGSPALDFGDWFDFDAPDLRPHWPDPFVRAARAAGSLTKLLLLAGVACLVLLLLPAQTQRVENVVEHEPWKAGLVGLIAMVAYVFLLIPAVIIASLILCITIIGIPVAVLLVLLVVLASLALPMIGYTAVAGRVGAAVAGRLRRPPRGRFWVLLVGVAAIEVWLLVASLLGGNGWMIFLPVVLLVLFGWVFEFSAWTVGIGAVLIAFLGGPAGQGRSGSSLPLPLPPLPDLPPEDELRAEFDSVREAEAAAEEAAASAAEAEDSVVEAEAAARTSAAAAKKATRRRKPAPKGPDDGAGGGSRQD